MDLPVVGRCVTTGICRGADRACLGPGPGREDLGPHTDGATLAFAGFMVGGSLLGLCCHETYGADQLVFHAKPQDNLKYSTFRRT